MNRKTKDCCRANRGGRGRWAGTRPGAELSRATPCSLCVIGPTCFSCSPRVCLHRKLVNHWTWPPSPRGWSSGGRHPAHRPWSWGRWASRGASDPETSRGKWPTAPSAPPSVSPAWTVTDTVDFSFIREFKNNKLIEWCKLWPSHKYSSLSYLLLPVLQVFNKVTRTCSTDNSAGVMKLFVFFLQIKHIEINDCSQTKLLRKKSHSEILWK